MSVAPRVRRRRIAQRERFRELCALADARGWLVELWKGAEPQLVLMVAARGDGKALAALTMPNATLIDEAAGRAIVALRRKRLL